MSDSKQVVDIDALVPPSVTIKFDKQEIEVQPPKTVDILRLGPLGAKIQAAGDLSDEELQAVIDKIHQLIYKTVPELEGKEFNTAQLLKLIGIISDMAIPPDAKELQDRGISAADPKAP